MPTATPDVRPAATGTFARTTITIVMAVIAALAFVFSFGNVWALALRLGVPRPIAPLIAPMVDLSVVGLLVALHHLAAHGTDPADLRSATRLMHLCGLLTVALNTAEPLLARHYGRAALDTVAPALLLGWGTVGPTLLRHLHAPAAPPADAAGRTLAGQTPTSDAATPPTRKTSVEASAAARQSAMPGRARTANAKPAAPGKRTGRPPAATMDPADRHSPTRHRRTRHERCRDQEGAPGHQHTDQQRPLHRTDAAHEGRTSPRPGNHDTHGRGGAGASPPRANLTATP